MYPAKIPADCWVLISDYLATTSLKHLAETSRGFSILFEPLLYKNINLSVHHHQPIVENGRVVTRWPLDLEAIVLQQHRFMKKLLHYPEYAQHVKSLTWTMGLLSLCTPKPGFGAIDPNQVFAVFAMLSHVTHLDLDGGPIHPYRAPVHLPPLFPNAHSIRLSGKMHYALASAILDGSDKAQIQILEISNLFEKGSLPDGKGSFADLDLRYYDSDSDDPDDCISADRWPGDMYDLYSFSLESRCTHLRQLSLNSVDLEWASYFLPSTWHYSGYALHDKWDTFIQRTQPDVLVLRYTRLCNEKRDELRRNYYKRRCNVVTIPSPLDQLVPTLQRGWPKLKRIEIYGDIPNEDTGFYGIDNVDIVVDQEAYSIHWDGLCIEDQPRRPWSSDPRERYRLRQERRQRRRERYGD